MRPAEPRLRATPPNPRAVGLASRAARAGACALLAASLAGVLACGSASKDQSPQAPGAASAPATVDEAVASLDRAEGELDSVFPRAFATAPGQAAPMTPSRAEPAPDAAPPPTTAAEAAKPADRSVELSSDPCAVACRALASMGRAAEHICGLAGESDARCSAARGRVTAAAQRVHAQCRC